LKPVSRESQAEQIRLFESALTLDPRSAEAQNLLANALASRVLNGLTGSATTDIARAEGLAGQALATSPRSPLVHFAKGEVLRAEKRWGEAIPEYETVLAFDRNSADYSPSKFIEQIKMDFDQLYDEAAHRRRMMSVSAHDRISGSPQMVRAWNEFLRYAKGQPGVAFLRKDEIARYALESQLTLRESETI
jgi:tetratricopeptide (TPR) repeat protein